VSRVRGPGGDGSRVRMGRALPAIIALALLCSCTSGSSEDSAPPAPLPAQSTGALLPVDHWRQLFDRNAPTADADSERLSLSSDSYDFYSLSYAIDEQASMFQAVGDWAYAGRGLRYAMNMIGSARRSSSLVTSGFRDHFRGWVSPENDGDETPLYESYAWRYVTRLLRVIEPSLDDAPADIRREYARALAFTETDIVDKWLSRGADDYIYRSRTHMAAHWASIALDVSRLTADPARRRRCLQIVHNIDHDLPNYPSSLHDQMRPAAGDRSAYWWSDRWGDTRRPGQDVSHGNGVVAYVVEAHDLGVDWSARDIARLSRTLTGFVLGSPARYPAYVDGTGSSNGWIADGWVKLGRYDPAVQFALQSYPVQNAQFYAAMALNASLLLQHRQ
jgi:hypothetical protein